MAVGGKLDLVNKCALCGRGLPGTRMLLAGHGQRHWAGWEIKTDAGVHLRYIPDYPEQMCKCTGRHDAECDNNPPTPEENAFYERSEFCRILAK